MDSRRMQHNNGSWERVQNSHDNAQPSQPRPLRHVTSSETQQTNTGHQITRQLSNRIPFISFLGHSGRGHFVAMMGEFVGTFLFLFFAFAGTQVANNLTGEVDPSIEVMPVLVVNKLLYISLSFGFSLAVNAWVFFRISGGLFNPAVSLALCLVGALPWLRGVLLTVSQILGAICAAAVVSALFPSYLFVQTTLSPDTSVVRGLFIEAFLTAQLVFTIIMLAAEKHKATFLAPIGIGLALFIAEMTGVYFTGGSLNPARSFAPNVVLRDFQTYHWIYWVGPILGAILASGFYVVIKKLEYETANPGQDDTGDQTDVEQGSLKSPQ